MKVGTPLDRNMTAPDVRLYSYKHVATYKYIQKIAPNGRNGLKIQLASIAHTLDRTYQDDAEQFLVLFRKLYPYAFAQCVLRQFHVFFRTTRSRTRILRRRGLMLGALSGLAQKNLRSAAFFSIFLGVLELCGLALSDCTPLSTISPGSQLPSSAGGITTTSTRLKK